MPSQVTLLKLTLCGPADVSPEMVIAKEVINEWNSQHGEAMGFFVKHQHWSTDAFPNLDDRPQAVINRQIIDGADVLVAIFWSRFGTPTGAAHSGTEEEIRRGIQNGRKVLAYFSDLEPIPPTADKHQLNRLCQFRQDLYTRGLCWSFKSRDQFRKEFSNHLALLLNEFARADAKPARKPTASAKPKAAASVKQAARGTNIVQVGGNVEELTVNHHPERVKKVIARRRGSISPEEALRVRELISLLVDGEVKITREEAFGMWWGRFYNRFKVEKFESLPSSKMPAVEKWYLQQAAIQKEALKTKAPDLWRTERIRAIKAAMTQMKVVSESYYPEVASRLGIKPFTSLKALTKTNLDRVYRMALRDRKQ